MRKSLSAALATVIFSACLLALPRGAAAITDDEVWASIQKGREWLLKQAKPDGSFGENGKMRASNAALAFMTLAYMGEHPNREVMSKGLEYLMGLDPQRDFHRPGYAVPVRDMGFSYIYNKLADDRKARLKALISSDILSVMVPGQNLDKDGGGGWRYEFDRKEYDFSVTQWPILAMREASLIGVEFPPAALIKARGLYLRMQNKDGGWAYQGHDGSYGSMTAAGLASLFIISDVLEPGSGCPCTGGDSRPARSPETEKSIDRALDWLAKNFAVTSNPHSPRGHHIYWLYCVERVGIAAGYKYFGTHNWYREGAEFLVKAQKDDGSWNSNAGPMEDTCFALLFLYKGRAPILYNKCKFDGEWNPHRRDMANLVNQMEREKEQQFHWQIVDLKSPLDELHDAPILYISAETAPKFSDADKQKLRAFTDTGGTVLMEASCGNGPTRIALRKLCTDVWPEWKLQPVPGEHPVWAMTHQMHNRPELFGISDGVRTSVFYSPDDISCAWQTRAVALRKYIFDFGTNLYAYATDGAPLRAKLSERAPAKTDRYTKAAAPGPRDSVKVARVSYAGRWEAGANYGGLRKLAEVVKARSKVQLQVTEPSAVPFTTGGVAPSALAGYDVAYIAGSDDVGPKPEERDGLTAFVNRGGFLWIEAVGGSQTFDATAHKMVEDLGLKLQPIPVTHPLMTGDMAPGQGYDLRTGVEFLPTLKIQRLGRQRAEFLGIYKGDRLVGIYSPLDITFSLTGLDAGHSSGYKPEDAAAVATNIAVFLSTLK